MMGYQYLECFAPDHPRVQYPDALQVKQSPCARIDQLSEDAAKECEIEQHKADQDALFQTESFDFYKGEAPEDFLYHIGQLTLKKNGLYVIKGENGSGKKYADEFNARKYQLGILQRKLLCVPKDQ